MSPFLKALETSATNPADSLPSLLARWRESRDPRLAALIDRVGAAAGSGRPPIDSLGKTPKVRQEAWLALAKDADPAYLERLLPYLPQGNSKLAQERLAELEAWEDDPRLARALTELIAKPPFQGQSTRPFWKRVFERVGSLGDPRTAERLTPLCGTFFALFGAQGIADTFEAGVKRVLATVAAHRPVRPLSPAESEAVARALAAEPAPRTGPRGDDAEPALLRAICENIEDDAPRMVYSDWLEEHGQAERAEAIRVGVRLARGQALEKDERRQEALWKKHGKTWYGEVWSAFLSDDRWIDRGFLAGRSFEPKSRTAAERAATSPGWDFVRELRFTREADMLLSHQALPNLRWAAVNFRTFPVLGGAPCAKRLRGLELLAPTAYSSQAAPEVGPEHQRLLASKESFPALERLHLVWSLMVPGDVGAALLAASAFTSAAITVSMDPAVLPKILSMRSRPERLALEQVRAREPAWSGELNGSRLTLRFPTGSKSAGEWLRVLSQLETGALEELEIEEGEGVADIAALRKVARRG